MSWSKLGVCLALMFLRGTFLEAQTVSALDLWGRIELSPDPDKEIRGVLEIRDPKDWKVYRLQLSPEATGFHRFNAKLPDHLMQSDLVVYVEIDSPAGYVSSQPDYRREGGKPLAFRPLLLKKASEAYAKWIGLAREAGLEDPIDPDLGIRRLDRLEKWPLMPQQRLEVTLLKADICARVNRWGKQQKLMRDAFHMEWFRGITKKSIFIYFRQRERGIYKLATGDFATAVLGSRDLQDLWKDLVADFVDQYSSCKFNAADFSFPGELTIEAIARQRNFLSTWLGRPGTDVKGCQ